jgi:hypothetical protein
LLVGGDEQDIWLFHHDYFQSKTIEPQINADERWHVQSENFPMIFHLRVSAFICG